MAQTALQELIEWIDTFQPYGLSRADVRHKSKSLIPKERQIIEDAFVAGDERGTGEIPFNAEQYFTQNFNQNS